MNISSNLCTFTNLSLENTNVDIFIIIVLGYIMTFTKVLAMYYSRRREGTLPSSPLSSLPPFLVLFHQVSIDIFRFMLATVQGDKHFIHIPKIDPAFSFFDRG
jgi:hypothetical protein